MTTQPDQEIINAARKVLREALDAVAVHPCDEHNDLVRAASLYGPMEELYKAMFGQPDQDQMTLRDQFAMAALNGLIAKEYKDDVKRGAKGVPIMAQYAYEYADAMIEERKPK